MLSQWHDGKMMLYTGGVWEAVPSRRGVCPMGTRENPTDSHVANEGAVLPGARAALAYIEAPSLILAIVSYIDLLTVDQ